MASSSRRLCGGSFFFQAEDGIRYYKVTGVQTCALPICTHRIRVDVCALVRRRRLGCDAPESGRIVLRLSFGESDPSRTSGNIYTVAEPGDRKSTRLNSSHLVISYAVFCLKKKTKEYHTH